MNSKQAPFILIDGSSYFYRAFHALPPLTNSKGEPTGAIYGVLNMIRRLLKDYQPSHIAVIFDAKGKTFRDDLYADYKATRTAMPDELSVQFMPLLKCIEGMGLPLLMVDGVEADDVIGTLASQAGEQGMPTVISTSDKDMAQLVNEHVTLINTMSNTVYDRDGVIEKFGVAPEQIIDYLTLIGDKVDNVPGVANVGAKTAAKWLAEYGTLDNLIENADKIKGKVGDNLRDALGQLPLSKQLITIKKDVPLDFMPSDLQMRPLDRESLIDAFQQLEFRNWLNELLGQQETHETNSKNNEYHIILNQKDFTDWLERLQQAELFSFDTETTNLDAMKAELVGLSFAIKSGEAAYVPLAHDYEGAPQQLNREDVLQALKPLLENPKKYKVGQNLKYDYNVLLNHHITLRGIQYDSMLESYVLNSSASRHDMDSLALKYLGKKTIHFEDIAGKGAKQKRFNEIDINEAGPYAAEDADITLQLHETLFPKVQAEKGLLHIFNHIEMPLLTVLAEMERVGVLIDKHLLAEQSVYLQKRLTELEQETYSIAGETFNLASPKQLQVILFEKLGLPVLQKTPTGQPSTAEAVLHDLAYDFPLPKLILEYRSLSKLKSTYTDSLPLQINEKTGRVHTSYNQAVAATGRLSSTEPNLQNIPIRTEEGRKVRQAFIAPSGYKILSADYSQIELRIMAHLSGDKSLQDAFAKGLDIHKATAAEVFGVALDDVTHEQRRKSKAINFGLIYGMSSFGLAKQIGVDRQAAQLYIDVYFQRYPGVKQYMEETRQKAHETGYVETIYGRRLYLPDINTRNLQRQKAAERTAINAPMQGTAADIIKMAMINVAEWLRNASIDARMIMQVHDELILEVAEKDVELALKKLKELMCNAADLNVPLEVGVGVGNNWDEAH